MRERDDIAGFLDGLNSGYAGDGQHITFFDSIFSDQAQGDVAGETDVADGDGGAMGDGFVAGGYEVDFGGGC